MMEKNTPIGVIESDYPPWKEEEDLINATKKDITVTYESESDSTDEEDEADTESEEEETYTRGQRRKRTPSKLNLSQILNGSGSAGNSSGYNGSGTNDGEDSIPLSPIMSPRLSQRSTHEDTLSPLNSQSFSPSSHTRGHYRRSSMDSVGYSGPHPFRNRSNSSGIGTIISSPTPLKKPLFNSAVIIKPIDLRGLKNSIDDASDERKVEALRLQKRELGLLMDKRELLQRNISTALEGYNDIGPSVDDLEIALKKLNLEISSLEGIIAASPLVSPHVHASPRSYSPGPNSPTSRKFSQELKMELRQLDPRLAVYTSPRRQSKGNTWQLDTTDTEAEREKKMNDTFERVNAFLLRHGPEIPYSEIRLSDRVGEGSSSIVFEGVWNDFKVAVKKLKTPVSEDRLIADVNRIQRLHHPNILLAIGACRSPPCVVMEHMNLGSLYDILHTHNVKLDTQLLVKIAKELATAMCHLHNQKTVHGNLWSKYIFMSQVDRHKTVRVGGLKLSKDVYLGGGDGRITSVPPKYRPPELARGGKITEKVDVYAYGMILWEMVSNKIPFRKHDDVEAAAKAAYEHLRPKIPGTCPRILRLLIARCWAPNPDERPSFVEVLKFFNHLEGKLFFIPSKGGIWTLDKVQELEQEQSSQKRFDEVVAFLKKREIMLQFTELRLRERVGEGSFAKVWDGEYAGYRVAVKKLKNVTITTNFFLREVANLQKTHHPNVVLFMGACVQPPCIVTEFMAGGSLFDVLHVSNVKLDIWIFLKFALNIAEGMMHLHSLKILHRDLTSKNILLDEFQNVKISDFGLSREVEVEMTLAGICNPRWRPPEITKGITNYDGKVDVYSYGLVLFEMVSGKIPFEKFDSVTAAARAAYENFRPVIPDDCHPLVRQLITRCWAQNPDDRPTFSEIVTEIARIKKQLIIDQGLVIKTTEDYDSDSNP